MQKIKIICVTGLFLLTGCQTHTQKQLFIRNYLNNSQYERALTALEESDLAKDRADFVLYKMEKGMLQYLMSDFQNATTSWKSAENRIEELFTTSVTSTAGSLIVNDTLQNYEGEVHEKILLPVFSALSYMAKNELSKARVEIKRCYELISFIEKEYEGKNSFQNNFFARYLSGLIYEANTEWDAAIIEYRKILEQRDEGMVFQDSQFFRQVASDLDRIARFRKRDDMIKLAQQHSPYENQKDHKERMQMGEVFVVYESGKSPIKHSEDIIFPTNQTYVRLSFPIYKNEYYRIRSAEIFVNDVSVGKTIVSENIGEMAKQALNDRKGRDLAKMAARVVAKDLAARKLQDVNPLIGLAANVAGVVSEVADTRSWSSLPDTIQIKRVPIPANKSVKISFVAGFGAPLTQEVNLKAGEKKLIRFRTTD